MQISQRSASVDGGSEHRVVGPVAIAAIAVSILLAVVGSFGAGENESAGAFLAVCAIVAVAAVAVFGFIVPRALRREATGGTGVVLAVLALGTVAVFWTGLPPILGAGAIVLGWVGRDSGRGRHLSRLALAIGVLALLADVGVVAGDWIANH
jgi:Kef-type K+ transport system membrane component KefB